MENLIIYDLKDLTKDAVDLFLSERKKNLKMLKINGGNEMSGDFLQNIPKCTALESLEIGQAFRLGVSGFDFISKLKNLKCLEISFTKRAETLGLDETQDVSSLRPRHLIALFQNENLKLLEKLSLAGSEIMDRHDDNPNDEVLKTIASNCPRLKYIDLYKGMLNVFFEY